MEGLRREEEKKKIGQGKGRNARKRKKEQKRRKEQEESGLEEEKTRLEENEKKLKDQSKVSEEQDRDETCLERHYELKQTENEEDKVMIIKEPKNRSLVEFMERQILELEEELECPVCLEVASAPPIFKCPDNHLICRFLPHSHFTYYTNCLVTFLVAASVAQNCGSVPSAGQP